MYTSADEVEALSRGVQELSYGCKSGQQRCQDKDVQDSHFNSRNQGSL